MVRKSSKQCKTLVDTASFYKNEEGVGEAVKNAGILRSDIFITMKVWLEDIGTEKTLKAFDDSLHKLQVDYIDLYLIHWPVPQLLEETWKVMEEGLYQKGKSKSYRRLQLPGIPNHGNHEQDVHQTDGFAK